MSNHPTTQEIYNRIKEIQDKGNWIESPFRHISWIPIAKLQIFFNNFECKHNDDCNCCDGIAQIKKEMGL